MSIFSNKVALKASYTGSMAYSHNYLSTAYGLSANEESICHALGYRLANVATALKQTS